AHPPCASRPGQDRPPHLLGAGRAPGDQRPDRRDLQRSPAGDLPPRRGRPGADRPPHARRQSGKGAGVRPWRRAALSSVVPIVSSLLAILAAFVVGGLFLELRGKDALLAYRILFERGLGNADGLTETFKQMAPLLIISGG